MSRFCGLTTQADQSRPAAFCNTSAPTSCPRTDNVGCQSTGAPDPANHCADRLGSDRPTYRAAADQQAPQVPMTAPIEPSTALGRPGMTVVTSPATAPLQGPKATLSERIWSSTGWTVVSSSTN